MKVLGKKVQKDIQTIEAYDIWGCSGLALCVCGSVSNAFQITNNTQYRFMKMNH